MKRRAALYSGSRPPSPPPAPEKSRAAPKKRATDWRKLGVPAAFVVLLLAIAMVWLAQPHAWSSDEIEALAQHLLDKAPPAPSATEAYEKVKESVVAVRAYADDGGEGTKSMESGKAEMQSGTGVIIVDSGIILTNLHVIDGAKMIHIVFSDGTLSIAEVIGERPEHDLAVLQAKTLPDDIVPATMRSTAGLRPGDEVVAVGFPFGIGPSASAGVISGLKRDYVTHEGKRALTNLIQFDAAVNPGNSGGPLVTLDGEVVGIVTGLLNPTENRVFIGIGFAVPIENAASAVGLSPF